MVTKLAITSTGPMSGKTTLAKYLEEKYGFLRVDHSRTVAENYAWYHNLYTDEPPLTVEAIYADKERYRPALQAFSLTHGFSSPSYAGDWTDETLKPWYESGESRDVVFEPFRGEVQAEEMRIRGFFIVQLDINEAVRFHRAKQLGRDYAKMMDSVAAHEELELGIANPDLQVSASLPVDQLAKIVLEAARGR